MKSFKKKSTTDTDKKEVFTGEITGIRFRNSDNWSVFSLSGHHESFTGVLAEMCDVGTSVTCTGVREISKYGPQIRAESVIPEAPDVATEAGVVKLLQRLPGIGPKKAMQAVQKHGHVEAWRLALSDPEEIGVAQDKVEYAIEIANSLVESYDATVYLLGIGLTDHQANLIYQRYGASTVATVSENPYLLTEIDGFGFLTVDKIALKAGICIDNQARIQACVLYVIGDSATNGGNIWFNGWSLAETVLETLSAAVLKAEVPIANSPDIKAVRQQVYNLAAEGKIVIKTGRVYGKELLNAEKKIVEFLRGVAA